MYVYIIYTYQFYTDGIVCSRYKLLCRYFCKIGIVSVISFHKVRTTGTDERVLFVWKRKRTVTRLNDSRCNIVISNMCVQCTPKDTRVQKPRAQCNTVVAVTVSKLESVGSTVVHAIVVSRHKSK